VALLSLVYEFIDNAAGRSAKSPVCADLTFAIRLMTSIPIAINFSEGVRRRACAAEGSHFVALRHFATMVGITLADLHVAIDHDHDLPSA